MWAAIAAVIALGTAPAPAPPPTRIVFASARTAVAQLYSVEPSGEGLAQLTFVGLGAYVFGTWGGGSLIGVVLAVVISAVVGALVALPTLRLRGLYLALATFAFATAMDTCGMLRAAP